MQSDTVVASSSVGAKTRLRGSDRSRRYVFVGWRESTAYLTGNCWSLEAEKDAVFVGVGEIVVVDSIVVL